VVAARRLRSALTEQVAAHDVDVTWPTAGVVHRAPDITALEQAHVRPVLVPRILPATHL
jgi:hypothetical protein